MKIRIRRIVVPTLVCLAVACLIEIPLGQTTIFGEAVVLWDTLLRAILAVPMLVLFYREDRVFRGEEKWGPARMCAAASLGAAVSLGFGFLMEAMKIPGYESVKGAFFAGPLWLQAIVLLAASPLLEELFFRGVLYQRFKELMNPWLSALVTAALFSVFHGNAAQGIYSFFMGLLLAYAMERCQTVKAPIVLHAAANGAALLAAAMRLW